MSAKALRKAWNKMVREFSREAAYYAWKNAGEPPGHELEFWLIGKAEIHAKLGIKRHRVF